MGTAFKKTIGRRAPGTVAARSPLERAAERAVPRWGVAAAAAAVAILVGGCWLATAWQPPSFDWVTSSVSYLAAPGAADRWLTTAAFALTGVCVAATARALRPAALPGRLLLATAGVASVLVAANPEHAGGSLTHGWWAAICFTALTLWPAAAWRREPAAPWGLRPAVSVTATAVQFALLAWFAAELVTRGGVIGLAERAMGTAEVSWPLVVVLSCHLSREQLVREPRDLKTAALGPKPLARCRASPEDRR